MPKLSRIWWTPLAFVIAALVLLLLTPLIVERRVAELRNALTNGSEQGRVLLNDLEAAFASRLLAGDHEVSDTTAVATPAHVRTDERELGNAVAHVGPEATARFDELRALLAAWNATPHDRLDDPATTARAREIFATAERLDNYLRDQSQTQRNAVQRLERVNVISALVLAPVALLAVLVVIWSGGRVVRFAAVAEAQRLEVVRAAEARAALLRGVTHDVKNPLGAAAGYAQLLEEGVVGPLSETQLDMVHRIRRLIDQSVDTVTDLLEVARVDSGGLQMEYERVDLASLVQEVVDDHSGQAHERGLSLSVDAAPTPLTTDPKRVRQILGNLLTNAIKYTPRGGVVEVRVVTQPSGNGAPRTRVEVCDDGPGIPPELRPRVFEEFFRVRPEGGARGNGLGLAISRRIARLLGGDVTYAPGVPRGSVFTLWLDSPRS